jgi:hypothetical protein
MGIYLNDNIHISGNFNRLSKRKPKNWIDVGYKIIVPYKFKWRAKIGSIECDCKMCEEHYAPYYGTDWYHSKDCALMKYIDKRPQVLNLWQYANRDMSLIVSTEY